MSAKRILLIAGVTAVMGATLSPAQAELVVVPDTYGVTFEAQDQYGNRLEGQAFYRRVADTDSQRDRYIIFCEVHALLGNSEFPDVPAVGAAVGIDPSNPASPDGNEDGCYLTLDGVAVFNAPGIGVSGEEAATSSLRNTSKDGQYFEYDGSLGGTFEACIRVKGLYTTGALVEADECGNQAMEF